MRMNAQPRGEAAADRSGEDKNYSMKDAKTDPTETHAFILRQTNNDYGLRKISGVLFDGAVHAFASESY